MMNFKLRHLVLTTLTIFVCVSLFFIAALQSKPYTEASILPTQTLVGFIATVNPASFEPAYYGLPEVIAGYKIIVVETSENIACMPPGNIQLVLQTSQPDMETFLKNAPGSNVENELKHLNIKQPKQWEFEYAGPGITKAMVLSVFKSWDPSVMTTCIKFGPITVDETTLSPGMKIDKEFQR